MAVPVAVVVTILVLAVVVTALSIVCMRRRYKKSNRRLNDESVQRAMHANVRFSIQRSLYEAIAITVNKGHLLDQPLCPLLRGCPFLRGLFLRERGPEEWRLSLSWR